MSTYKTEGEMTHAEALAFLETAAATETGRQAAKTAGYPLPVPENATAESAIKAAQAIAVTINRAYNR